MSLFILPHWRRRSVKIFTLTCRCVQKMCCTCIRSILIKCVRLESALNSSRVFRVAAKWALRFQMFQFALVSTQNCQFDDEIEKIDDFSFLGCKCITDLRLHSINWVARCIFLHGLMGISRSEKSFRTAEKPCGRNPVTRALLCKVALGTAAASVTHWLSGIEFAMHPSTC